jgi:PAS domain S-box-containing protein
MALHPAEPKRHFPENAPVEVVPIRRDVQENADWYRDLVEHSPDLLCVHDLEGRLLSVNPIPARLAGYSVEELLGNQIRDFVDPQFRAHFDAYLREIAGSGEASGLMPMVARSGEQRLWEYHSTLRSEGVARPIVLAIAHDVTERLRAERALRSLHACNESLVRATDEPSLLTQICDLVVNVGGYRMAWVGYAEHDERKTVRVAASSGFESGYLDALNVTWADDEHGRGPTGTAIRTGQPDVCHDITSDPRFDPWREDAIKRGLRSSLSLPLTSGDEVLGALSIYAAETGIFDTAEQRLLEELANNLSYGIVALRAREERKRAEEALRQSEEELRQAQRIGRMGSWYRDVATDTFTWSNQLYCILGMDPKEPPPNPSQSEHLFTPESHRRLMQANERLLSAGESDQLEVEFRRQNDGASGWAFLYREADRDEAGNIVRIRGIALDITERKRAEEALRQSEERFRVALKSSPTAVFNQDRNLRYTWMYNPQLPLSVNDYLGKTVAEVFDPEEAERIAEVRQRVMETGVGVRHELPLTYGGKKRYFDTTIDPVFDAAGAVIGITGATTEVTELREATEALREAKRKLTEEKLYLEQEIDTEVGFEDIIGQSKALQDVMEQVGKVASGDATVLLLGETGTGKELVARAVHRLSQRANNSFIKMNCAAIPSGLLESELFGNEKGAFTGAVSKKIGRLELADKGTLFLDEIGEISLPLQPKLLRVLQDQEFERLGGTHTLKVNFRLIAATNRDLVDAVREKEFRSDLYYRINVFPIRVPPLRERRDDIRLLVEHFVQKFARRMNKSITSIPKKTMDALMGWDWPGNVRELENFVERSVILSQGSVLASPLCELQPMRAIAEQKSVDETLEATERQHILRALRESHGQIGGPRGAAMRLGLKRTTLQSKLKRLGINPRPGPSR